MGNVLLFVLLPCNYMSKVRHISCLLFSLTMWVKHEVPGLDLRQQSVFVMFVNYLVPIFPVPAWTKQNAFVVLVDFYLLDCVPLGIVSAQRGCAL